MTTGQNSFRLFGPESKKTFGSLIGVIQILTKKEQVERTKIRKVWGFNTTESLEDIVFNYQLLTNYP